MKKNNKFASIDIGSHNCRLLISESKKNLIETVYNSSIPTNLIKNLSYNNEFNDHNIKKTIESLTFFSRKIRSMNVINYRCVATEACRCVVNPEFFLKKVKEKTDLDVEVISYTEEARLSMKSCRKYISKIESFGLIFDIGGGSTELSCFKINPNETITKSISYGVINYDEKCEIFSEEYVTKQLNNHFLKYFGELKNKKISKFSAIGSCSTVTSLCCIFLNLPFYNPKKIEGFEMDLDDIIRTINFVQSQSDNNLKDHPCIGSRYQLLKSGVKILKIILSKFPIDKLIVTQKGLRDALVEEIILGYEKNKTTKKT